MVRVPGLAGQFLRIALVTSLAIAFPRAASAQIVTGSDGSDGAFTFVQDTGPGAAANTMTIDLSLAASGVDGQGQPITWQTPSPVAGRGVYDPFAWAVVFKYASVDVPAGKTVRFLNHGSRAPVVWLSQASIVVRGTIDVSAALVPNPSTSWPEPGPGGFRGSGPPIASAVPGFGPGGGGAISSYEFGNYAGPASGGGYGRIYGGPGAFPLIGGSGGSNHASSGVYGLPGGPGGGAILLAARQSIECLSTASVKAWPALGSAYPRGSGGAIRLVADVISLPNNVTIDAWESAGGSGRVRLECNSFLGFASTYPPASFATPGPLLPDSSTPAVRVVSLTIGGQNFPVPVDPRASFSFPQADLRVSSSGTAQLTLEARNIAPGHTCEVRVANPRTPGAAWTTSTPLAGTTALSTATVAVPLAIGLHAVQVRVVL
ncbi:MAG: hypothetical protein NTY35_03685 [Planctomycetota bacterium]|nr:hypothetical protein [Planctomycetota bacterium]